MPFFRVFLSMIFVMGFATPAFCGVGDVDNREYVSDEEWSQEPWKKYVALVDEQYNYESYCTAQYIAPNLILSAGHCLITGQDGYLAKNYKKEIIPIKKLYTTYVKEQNKFEDPGDWVVFLVQDPKYYSDSFFNIEKPETSQDFLQVQTAGWGSMRILTDEELTQIRNIIKAIPENTEDFFKDLNIKMFEQGMELIYDVHDRLKKSGCHIALADCQTLSNNPNFTSACKNSANLNKINFPNILATTCDIMDGNSGGAVIDMTGSRLYGTVSFGSGGRYQYYDDTNRSYIASSYQFHDKVETLKREHSVTVPNESGPANDEIPPATPVQNLQPIHPSQISTKIDDLTGDIAALGTRLQAQYPGIAEAPDERLLNFLATVAEYQVKSDRLEELKKKYQEAKEREQSDANRALTAVTTAMTGLGTMAAVSALAERKADEKAEADMRQYLTTMQCEYGKGNIVNAGNEEITIPGGNELSKYYAEYKSLADNLKTTKTALGLRAGIESETLYEKSQLGLYQYSAAERQTGAYASLARALTDPESQDAAAWTKQQKDTKTKLIAGAAVAGAGVVGGIAGNLAINGNYSVDYSGLGSSLRNKVDETNDVNTENLDDENLVGDDMNTQNKSVTIADYGGNGSVSIVPKSNQVSSVLFCPWKWLFKTTSSTTFDGDTRKVEDKSINGEETIAADIEHVIKFLEYDTTNAPVQCITIDSQPKRLAEIVMSRYVSELAAKKPEITIQYQLNQSSYIGRCSRSNETCDDVVTHVYNRPCDGDVWTPTRVKSETKTVHAPVNANTVNNSNAIIEQWKNEFRQKYSSYEITEDNSAKLFEFIEGDENHPDYINLRTTCQQLIDQGTRYDWHIAGDKEITIDGYGTVIVNKHICDGYH